MGNNIVHPKTPTAYRKRALTLSNVFSKSKRRKTSRVNQAEILISHAHTQNIWDRFNIDSEVITGGSCSSVRPCTDQKSNKKFAVKSISKCNTKITRLQREVEILKSIHHPNIISLLDVYEDTDFVHLVTHFYDGGTLSDRMAQRENQGKGFQESEMISIASQMFDALAHCHKKGIAHRDIKPENFVFESMQNDMNLKLIDFGLSKLITTDHTFNTRHTWVGTVFFVAPEVIGRLYHTTKCDIWSVGIILYILCCGRPPFDGHTEEEIFYKITHQNIHSMKHSWGNTSPYAKELILSLLCKDEISRPTAKQALSHPWFKSSVHSGLY